MIYFDFKGEKISKLGFGLMRLPVDETGGIDEREAGEMIRLALEGGVNYFDTAAPYHAGRSEVVAGKFLSRYPRESYYLADKYPGHQIADDYNPKETFEKQLKKCKTDYFDFYLLHNVCEHSYPVYMNPKYGIIDYFIEQKNKGRIKHLGFSSHGLIPNLRDFLGRYSSEMEFCQIQLNYLDWTLQKGAEKVEILKSYGIPAWIMEPLRGGKLVNPPPGFYDELKKKNALRTLPEWGFGFLLGTENLGVILSGMSTVEQMKDNLRIFNEAKPLGPGEREFLLEKAEMLKKGVPCTGCGYCREMCPMGLDIPRILNLYNDAVIQPSIVVDMQINSLEEGKKPQDCLSCQSCEKMCPQGISIAKAMSDFVEFIPKIPSWAEVCRERAAAEKKDEENGN